jgi:hypothetical protein
MKKASILINLIMPLRELSNLNLCGNGRLLDNIKSN